MKAGVPIADLSAGLFCAIGLLAALRRAERTGTGERVEVALAEACAALLTNQAMNYLIGGVEPRAMGNVHPNVAPYQTFTARDGGLAIAALTEVQFARLCQVTGADELITDARFAGNAARVAHRGELEALLEERLAERPSAEWVQALNEAGIPAAVLNSVAAMLDNPDTRAGLVAELEDGTPQLRTPIRLGGEPLGLSAAPPRRGEHSDAIRYAVAAEDD